MVRLSGQLPCRFVARGANSSRSGLNRAVRHDAASACMH
jgi:hypothetical protein